MPYQLKQGEGPPQAALALLGDSRLINEIDVVDGKAYVKGESLGPPAKWAAAPPRLPKPEVQTE